MKIPALFTMVVVIVHHTTSACPSSEQLVKDVHKCLATMMIFVDAEESERLSKCPDLRKGVDCVDGLVEDCKDNEAIKGEYSGLKKKMAESRRDFETYCESSSTRASLPLVLLTIALSFWFKFSHL